jgi:hypothetical protein
MEKQGEGLRNAFLNSGKGIRAYYSLFPNPYPLKKGANSMNKKLTLFAILFTVLCPLSTVYAMGTAPPTKEVEIIEKIATQTQEAVPKEEYEMKVFMEIPWGSKPGELGVQVVEGLAIVPDRIAVDGKGNIYIFDKANNRINKYNKFGRFVRDYDVDSFKKLPPAGDNPNPVLVQNDIDMGVDDEGNIYVLNSSDARIRKLNSKGETIDNLPAPAGANYIRVERDGKVEAMKYKDGQIEIFDVSSKQMKIVSGFRTPGGISVVLGEDKGVNEPRVIKIFDKGGNLVRGLEIRTPYELYTVDFLGTDDGGNIFLAIQRESDETRLKEVAPKEFKTVRLLGWYIRKYNKTGQNQLAEEKFILEGTVDTPIDVPGYNKCFTVDKDSHVYLMVMYGSPYAYRSGTGRFKIFKWEIKK